MASKTLHQGPARSHLAIAAPLLAVLLAGCASHAAMDGSSPASNARREAAGELYGGQSQLVHATEFPVESAADGMARGDEAWQQGQLDLATYLYIQSLAFDPDNAAAFLRIASIHERRGNRSLAEKAFEQALQLDPQNAGACERLGLLYLKDGRDDAARWLLERAIVLDSGRWQSHNGLGILADRTEFHDSAIAHYDAALALEPRAAMVVNNRGYSRYLAGDFAGAEADFQIALSLGSKSGTWTNLGRAQARQRRYQDALESFSREHDLARAHNLLGESALENGDLEVARGEFVQALSASPRFFQAAQDNLDQVDKRITEEAMKREASSQAAARVAAPALPVGAATAAATLAASQRQARASCLGAAALKPRCTTRAARLAMASQQDSAGRHRN